MGRRSERRGMKPKEKSKNRKKLPRRRLPAAVKQVARRRKETKREERRIQREIQRRTETESDGAKKKTQEGETRIKRKSDGELLRPVKPAAAALELAGEVLAPLQTPHVEALTTAVISVLRLMHELCQYVFMQMLLVLCDDRVSLLEGQW